MTHPLKHIPGDLGLPLIGSTFEFLADADNCMLKRQKKYGNIFKIRMFGNDGVVLLGPAANKFLLIEQDKYVSSQESWETILSELFPNGLMLMDGERHKKHRGILNEAFKKEPMQGYQQMIKPIIESRINDLPIGESFQFYLKSKELALQIAGGVFFGLDFEEDLTALNRDIIAVLKASMAIPIKLPFTKYGRGVKARKRLDKYFLSMIAEKRAKATQDIFSMLCHSSDDNGQVLDDQEIVDHLVFILMAGHDTAATTLSSMVYLLGKHHDWQKKAREEAQNFIHSNPDYDLKSLSQLKILGLIIKETLRMYVPVTTVGRRSKHALSFEGYDLPAETNLSVVFQHSNKYLEQWADPEKFNPARFDKPVQEHRKCPHAYAPFGAGPHHCIGFAFAEMELKMSILSLLLKYKWTFDPSYKMKMNQVPIQEPKDNLPIILQKL